ncbi:MAG: arylsulfatase [Armatimonadia bacterium]|nr:arylsulfatase [Armatimonadia bacterium]
MDRRQFIGATAGAMAAAATSRARADGGRIVQRPNVLFLMADQHRGDCVGADGNPHIHTPSLDRIAREGALFSRAYTSTPSCTPARAGLLTGLSPWHHGMLAYGAVSPRYEREKPRLMRDAGYYTTGIGKMHWHPQRHTHGYHQTIVDESGRAESPEFVSDYRQWFREVAPDLDPDATGVGWNDHMGRMYVLPEELHPTRWTGDVAVDFLETYHRPEPFFLKVSFARPHSPYDPPQRFYDMYENEPVPGRVLGEWCAENRLEGEDLPSHLARGDVGAETVRHSRRCYYGSVSFIDEQVGRMLSALERRGLLDNTLIVYTSDHGDMLGDHHMWRKTFAFEGSARIPMLMRWPEGMVDGPRGRVESAPVELRDILPTCLHAAGAPYDPSHFDGGSMLSLLQGRGQWRDAIDLEHGRCYWPENQWTALTDGHTKYIYFAPTGEEMLFDLDRDPNETRDLARSPGHDDLRRHWRQRMVEHLAERGEPWVVDGDLGLRPDPMVYGPNYPRI